MSYELKLWAKAMSYELEMS